MKDAEYWIRNLNLSQHPEGGYFRETYRARETVTMEQFSGPRAISTHIYFLLKGNQVSLLHRIKSDELWHFYTGSSLTIHIINHKGRYERTRLGSDFDNGDVFQTAVKAGCWFGACVDHPDSYSLVGCTVAPGFDFNDFEMGNRNKLIEHYPEYVDIIKRLTKPPAPAHSCCPKIDMNS